MCFMQCVFSAQLLLSGYQFSLPFADGLICYEKWREVTRIFAHFLISANIVDWQKLTYENSRQAQLANKDCKGLLSLFIWINEKMEVQDKETRIFAFRKLILAFQERIKVILSWKLVGQLNKTNLTLSKEYTLLKSFWFLKIPRRLVRHKCVIYFSDSGWNKQIYSIRSGI